MARYREAKSLEDRKCSRTSTIGGRHSACDGGRHRPLDRSMGHDHGARRHLHDPERRVLRAGGVTATSPGITITVNN